MLGHKNQKHYVALWHELQNVRERKQEIKTQIIYISTENPIIQFSGSGSVSVLIRTK